MYRLSKSKILSGLQCPKRLYLEVHRPDLIDFSGQAERAFSFGDEVGKAARNLYPDGRLIGHDRDLASALADTDAMIRRSGDFTLFEGAFRHGQVLIRADVIRRRRRRLHLVEVKSSTELKPHYIPDVAIQAWVMQGAGAPVDTSHVWHIDNSFVYGGDGDYRALFKSEDVGEETASLLEQVPRWVAECQKVLAGPLPEIEIGPQCHEPNECPFLSRCAPKESEFPVTILPYGGRLVKRLVAEGYKDLRDVPEGVLTKEHHLKIWRATRNGKAELSPEAAGELRALPYPRYYLDFETVQFAVPVWAGTRPYEQLPFQWSCHVETVDGRLVHREFLDAGGDAPMRRFAESLIAAVGSDGPIFVYSHFERTILKGLIQRFPEMAKSVNRILGRLFDLYPFALAYYYHPAMKGSWSIKAVLPSIAPELGYESLGEVRDGGGAQDAFREILDPSTDAERKARLLSDLKGYCRHDTLALVEIARYFEGRRTG